MPADASTDSGCEVPIRYYRDADDDRVGDDSVTVLSCVALGRGWVLSGGDCRDDLPDVFKDQPDYFATGYSVAEGVSFDYDCSGGETLDPSQPPGGAPTCGSLDVPCSLRTGFLATTRSGLGVNPYCGSATLVSCVTKNLLCTSQASPTSDLKRCR
jgi:hypothetical protein